MDVAIRNGTVVTAEATFAADVGIAGGRIAQVGGSVGKAAREIDAKGLYVMPGAVDVHTHLDMPFMGTATADDHRTGTQAAAAGGVTTLIDFAMQPKGATLVETLDIWKKKAAGKAAIDYSFHVAVTEWSESVPDQIQRLADDGFPSLKVFMAYKHQLQIEDEVFLRILKAARKAGSRVMVHAENGDAAYILQQDAIAAGKREPKFHSESRPRIIEGEAVSRAIMLAELAGAPLFVVHNSCQEAIYHISVARRRGLRIFGETCPQYLGAITVDDLYRPGFEGAKYVCTPPLRDSEQAKAMWSALAADMLQWVSSDHCPFRMDQRRMGQDDFTQIPNGVPGVETLVPLVWTMGVGSGRISPNRFVELISTAPARFFGLAPRKGTLSPGADGDVMLFDPAREVTLAAKDLHQNLDYTPYEGFKVTGYPVTTISRGEVVWEKGVLSAAAGRGQLIPRAPLAVA